MTESEVLADCDEIGVHPASYPLGDSHHTDAPITAEDERLGGVLAWHMGTLFSDVYDGKPHACACHFYNGLTSHEEWVRVARALRIHGLVLTDKP